MSGTALPGQVLLVTDGDLDFGEGDFVLSTFVGTLLNDGRANVAFDVALAHLRAGVAEARSWPAHPGSARHQGVPLRRAEPL
jgi:hypothetical protein